MSKIDPSEYDLSEDEADKALKRAKRKKKRKSGSSKKSSKKSSSSSDEDGSIWFWIVIGIAVLIGYGADASGILF